MPVFHVKKTKDYTVMAYYHLRDKSLSLKAKGLLSQMLSLPEEWDYTLQGLTYINREQIDAIRQAVHELERAGYIVRVRERDSRGRLRGGGVHHLRTAASAVSFTGVGITCVGKTVVGKSYVGKSDAIK